MVSPRLLANVAHGSLLGCAVELFGASSLFADDPQLPIQRFDPVTRTKVIMALLGLVLLAAGAMACIRLGGRWAKRLTRSDPPAKHSPDSRLPSDWERKG